MPLNSDVIAIVLGGGRGSRLFPLTQLRSKPAVPIGGKYRLVDIPISNCLHADIRRIFVLTQFNSASLNRHVSQTYRMDAFNQGFVEILAAEQTPDNPNWFQGTADAVRQAARHVAKHDADYYLILAGDQLYRMDFSELLDAHIDRRSDVTIAAKPVPAEDASSLGIFRFDRTGQIIAFEEKPSQTRLREIGQSIPPGALVTSYTVGKPFVASMGVYVFSRDVLQDLLASERESADFGREIIPAALGRYKVNSYLFRGYWADVGTVRSFYEANLMLASPDPQFSFYESNRPIYTHARFLPGSRLRNCRIDDAIVADGCTLDGCQVANSVVGIRSQIQENAVIRRSVILGADYYEPDHARPSGAPPLGIGRHAELDGVIVEKNARIGDNVRLVNAQQLNDFDGDGYYIRDGIIIVPKDGSIPSGMVI